MSSRTSVKIRRFMIKMKPKPPAFGQVKPDYDFSNAEDVVPKVQQFTGEKLRDILSTHRFPVTLPNGYTMADVARLVVEQKGRNTTVIATDSRGKLIASRKLQLIWPFSF